MFDNSAYMSNISLERTCDILKFTRSSMIVIMDKFGNILSDNDTILSNHRQPNKSKSPTVPSQFDAKLSTPTHRSVAQGTQSYSMTIINRYQLDG